MATKEELIEKTKALEEEVKKLKQLIEEPEKKERWRADKSFFYYYIHHNGIVIKKIEENTVADNNKYNTFNYYQTREEAERINRVQLAYRKLDWAIRQFETLSLGEYGYFFYLGSGKNDVVLWSINEDFHSPLPNLSNKEDAEYILSNYNTELLTFLTGGEK